MDFLAVMGISFLVVLGVVLLYLIGTVLDTLYQHYKEWTIFKKHFNITFYHHSGGITSDIISCNNMNLSLGVRDDEIKQLIEELELLKSKKKAK